eukprot:543465-Pyramimonas_sp.AAC.1
MEASVEEAQRIDEEPKRISQEQRVLRRRTSRALQSQLVSEVSDLRNHSRQAEAMILASRVARTHRRHRPLRHGAGRGPIEGAQGGTAVQPQDWMGWRAERDGQQYAWEPGEE